MATPIISNASGQFGASLFIVGPNTGSGVPYTTILSAVTAAAAASPKGSVFIQPGTYSESIAWPPGISVIGSSTGSTKVVTIVGSQSWNSPGVCSFENISFQSSQTTWTIGNGSNLPSLVEMTNCEIKSSGTSGQAFLVGSSAGPVSLNLNECSISVTGSAELALSISNSTVTAYNSEFNSSLSSNVAIGAAGIFNCASSSLIAGGGPCILIDDPTALVSSIGSQYNASSSAVQFNAAGYMNSFSDLFTSVGSNYVAGSSGTFFYSYPTIVNGPSSVASSLTSAPYSQPSVFPTINGQLLIGNTGANPQFNTLTAGTNISVTNGPGSITISSLGAPEFLWNTLNSTQSLVSGNGYILTGTGYSVVLPTAPNFGDEISIVNGGSGIVTISAPANTTVQIGVNSGTSITTSYAGDAMRIVSSTTGSPYVWIATSGVQGTFTIN
jgi:hypothetical protein